MKKYMLLFVGMWTPTDEIKAAWGEWFGTIGDKIVDGGNPFGAVWNVTRDGTVAVPLDDKAITGYTIINAVDSAEALAIAESCPMMTGVQVLEAASM